MMRRHEGMDEQTSVAGVLIMSHRYHRLMTSLRIFASIAVLAASLPAAAAGGAERFASVQTFLTAHCIECHGGKSKKADLALNVYADEAGVLKDRKVWQHVLEMVQEG